MSLRSFKKAFPFFSSKNISFLNSASTTHKPKPVVSALLKFSCRHKNISEKSDLFEKKMLTCKRLLANVLRCKKFHINFFPQGTTVCLNFLARMLFDKDSDRTIYLLDTEHNANVFPWQKLFPNVVILPQREMFDVAFKPGSVLALAAVSNMLGNIWKKDFSDLKNLISKAKDSGAIVVVDAAQAVIDKYFFIDEFEADYFAFSAHKFFGPTNLGVIISRDSLAMSAHRLDPRDLGFELIEFCQALKFVQKSKAKLFDLAPLAEKFYQFLKSFKKVKILNEEQVLKNQSKIILFDVEGVHPHDAADVLSQEGVVMRAGNHCALEANKKLNVNSSLRISLACYNDEKDFKRFKKSFSKMIDFFSRI